MYNHEAIDTLGKLATVAVLETAAIGMYIGGYVVYRFYKHKEKKAEKKESRYN